MPVFRGLLFLCCLVFYQLDVISASCEDALGTAPCEVLRKENYCNGESTVSMMRVKCAKTCAFCCKNLLADELCLTLKNSNHCEKDVEIMSKQCANTCSLCDGSNTGIIKETSATLVPTTLAPKVTESTPEDKHPSCELWAKSGECRKNPAWMLKNCVPSCKLFGDKDQISTPEIKKTNPTPSTSNKNCGGSNHLKRNAEIAIFVTPTYARNWRAKNGNDIDGALRNKLIPQLNRWFSPKELGSNIEIKFKASRIAVFSQADHNWILSKSRQNMGLGLDSTSGVTAFCEFLKLGEEQGKWKGSEWDLAIYLTDSEAEQNSISQAPGIVRAIEGVCNWKQAYNCGVIKGQLHHETLVFDRLLAHEIGHLIGFTHPENPSCQKTMMTAPGLYEGWSQCEKNKANELFKDPWKYPCLEYQCGQMPPPTLLPGGVLPEDKIVLNQVCKDFYKDGKEWIFDGEMKIKNPITNPQHDIQWLYYENSNWFLQSRVCYGIPCKEDSVTGSAIGAVRGIYMNGEKCARNKKCKNVVQNQKLVSAQCV